MRTRLYKETTKIVNNKPELIITKPEPNNKYFPKDWEWKYTFTEIYNDFIKLIKYKSYLLLINIIMPYFGLKINYYPYCYNYDYVDVDFDNIMDLISAKLTNYQKNNIYYKECAILVGKNIIKELDQYNKHLYFVGNVTITHNFRFGEPYCVLLGIPIYFIPDIEGIIVIPDLGHESYHIHYDTNYTDYVNTLKTQGRFNRFIDDTIINPDMLLYRENKGKIWK